MFNKLNNYKLDYYISQGKNAAGFRSNALLLATNDRYMTANYQSRLTGFGTYRLIATVSFMPEYSISNKPHFCFTIICISLSNPVSHITGHHICWVDQPWTAQINIILKYRPSHTSNLRMYLAVVLISQATTVRCVIKTKQAFDLFRVFRVFAN